MASLKFYLDERHLRKDGTSPLKLMLTHKGEPRALNMMVFLKPSQWNRDTLTIVNHPNKTYLNTYLYNQRQKIEGFILRLAEQGKLEPMHVNELKEYILESLSPGSTKDDKRFSARFLRFADTKTDRTKQIYLATYKRIQSYIGEKKLNLLRFEDINREWLALFEKYLAQTSPSRNARNIHFRNIRAVFNDAIDDEITTCYPFRKFKLKSEPTRKRSFRVDALRKIFITPLSGHLERYRDVFKLIFCLCGINVVDLCHLKTIEDGRIEYNRAKTHRHYSIKVEPEAMELIEKCKGVDWLLYPLDTNKSYRGYYNNLSIGLRSLKDYLNTIEDDIVIRELTTYWARHSWATVAASLDIPKETIAAALGHSNHTVTDIYIDFDQRKVDAANRKVLDYVLYDMV